MISDVLAEAVDELDRYLRDPVLGKSYTGPTRERIVWLRNGMELVRQELDQPPAPIDEAA